MELLIVHLTDIHISKSEDLDVLLRRTESIGGAICNHITDPVNTEVLLCITGDLVYSGKDNQYTIASKVLEDIYEIIDKRFVNIHIQSVFVPGNHDCDFSSSTASVRDALLSSPELDITDTSQFEMCTSIQKSFFDFSNEWKKNFKAMSCEKDKILTINELNLVKENIHIKFHCINTSWCSKIHEEKGGMKMVIADLPDKESEDIVITMMHHDAEWLDWAAKDVWNQYHKKYSDIILVGHDHVAEYVQRTNYDKSTNGFIKGNQLYDTNNPNQSGFNILKIVTDTEPMQECFFTYEWKEFEYVKVIDTNFQPFIRNRFVGNGIGLKEEVWRILEDLDIDIYNKKKKRELKLSEIFGFPTLKEEKDKTTRFFRDMKKLMEYIDDNHYITIRGQKEFGKTALLKQLFKEFYSKQKFPVFLDITQINVVDGECLNRIIADKYQQTYDNISPDAIMQKESTERVCLIDNFEEISLSDKSAKKFLQYLKVKFGKIILSKNQKLDIINPLGYVETNDFIESTFSTLIIQPVRKSYMERIVNQWLLLDGDEIDISSPSFDAKRREKYAQLQTVMKGNYFNKTPVDLLLVLSYLDQDEPMRIDYSRYSFIYDKLILDKLNAIGNKETKVITAYKTILQNIAYKMFNDCIQGYVKESYVIGVVLDYKEKHSGFKMKAGDVIQRLVNYRFLECKNDTYRFKYSYMYFYFAGSYIDKKLSPNQRQSVIREVFSNIDNELNYNIALFLAYSISIEFEILPMIKEQEERLLVEAQDFRYEKIKKLIEEWGGDIEKRVERIYTVPENENIPVLRERKMKEQEEAEAEEDSKSEEVDEQTPTDADVRRSNLDVIKLSRLVDFMGNILKNYSGGMENQQREETINLMFKSVTKVIGSFCNYSMYTVDKLIDMLEDKIKDGDEETIAAKSDFVEAIKFLLAEIWLQFISANISGLACSLECDDIKENLESYCQSNSIDIVKMTRVEYLIRIAATKLPVTEIKELYYGKNCIEDIYQNIFKNNIYRYLSSYQFDGKDRQAVCSILGFNIKDVLLEEQKLHAVKDK